MIPMRIAAIMFLATCLLGGSSIFAQETQYYYDYQNHLIEMNFNDNTWMQYTYDANGNLTSKIYNNTDYFPITVTAGAGGSVSPGTTSVVYGGNQTFTITPNQGWYLIDVIVDGNRDQGIITSYTFNDVTDENTIKAVFSQVGPVKNVRTGQYYQHLQDAYNAAQNGDTILAQSVLLNENFTPNQPISVTIDGGYTSDYSSNPGATTIKGLETVSNGTVIWKNFVISN